MMLSRSVAFVFLGLALATAAGCSSTTDDASSSEAAVSSAGLHEPQGDERKAIFAAFREVLTPDLHGQAVVFNNTNPAGRFQAHGDWASYEGVLEGPNATTINYSNSIYRDAAEGGYLDGVRIQGRFAAKFFALAQKVNGQWQVATLKSGQKTYAVGPGYDAWASWASLPPIAQRDVSKEFPKDDLHEPQGAERSAIIQALHAVIDPQLGGQSCAFNSNEPGGRFRAHDGWAYYEGIIEGPNGNTTAIDYQNSAFRDRAGKSGFEGVLKGGNFAAKFSALLEQQPDGTWKVSKQNVEGAGADGYAVGIYAPYFGDTTTSLFASDIYGGGCGNGNGNGDGDGDGDGGDGDGDGDGDGNGNGNGNGRCANGDGDGDGGDGDGDGDGG